MLRWTELARLAGLVIGVMMLVSLIPIGSVSASQQSITSGTPIDSLTISGRGWGHGRGMSQYGALGYASADHWTATEILDHYYGGTSSGPIPPSAVIDPLAVRVDLRYMHGIDTTVSIGEGGLELLETDGSTIANIEQNAVRLRSDGAGFILQTSDSCDGSWSTSHRLEETTIQIRSKISQQPGYAPDQKEHLLRVCGPTYDVWYDGSIQSTTHGGEARTVNVVPVETYLRGVVPNEAFASWPEASLQAQSVAARSYLMAGDRRQLPYADTCDNTRCQVYDGLFSERRSNHTSTHPRTDKAIEETAGVVRVKPSGQIARTEFSSSSGGYTAGGDFPAVEDRGDALGGNVNHSWTVQVSTDALEAYYNSGDLLGVEVTKRNGLGAYGGRAVEVVFTFETKSVTVSGNVARQRLGLKSDWFVVN